MHDLQGDTETARKSLEDAVDLKDNGHVNIAARLALANLLFVQGKHALALERQARHGSASCMQVVHVVTIRRTMSEAG